MANMLKNMLVAIKADHSAADDKSLSIQVCKYIFLDGKKNIK